MSRTCRCHMCGRKAAGKNNVRRDYLEAGAIFDEHAMDTPDSKKFTKKQSHKKLRRLQKKIIRQSEKDL